MAPDHETEVEKTGRHSRHDVVAGVPTARSILELESCQWTNYILNGHVLVEKRHGYMFGAEESMGISAHGRFVSGLAISIIHYPYVRTLQAVQFLTRNTSMTDVTLKLDGTFRRR